LIYSQSLSYGLFSIIALWFRSHDISIGIIYGTDGHVLTPSRNREIVLYVTASRPSLAHPASYPVDTGSLSAMVNGRGWKLSIHLIQFTKPRMLYLYINSLHVHSAMLKLEILAFSLSLCWFKPTNLILCYRRIILSTKRSSDTQQRICCKDSKVHGFDVNMQSMPPSNKIRLFIVRYGSSMVSIDFFKGNHLFKFNTFLLV
jgi:hypothetical protein